MRFSAWMVCLLLSASALQAEDWAQWRGPSFNGSSPEKGLPSQWSQTENVAWSVDLPGPSAATPVVSNGKVFVSSTDSAKDTLKAMCFDEKTGKLLWSHDAGHGVSQDTRSTYSAPSPATDGKIVAFFYGNGEMVVYDVDGNKKWEDNFGPFSFMWTFSSSPVLYDGTLYLQILQRDEPVRGKGSRGSKSFILALEPATGKTKWRHLRPSKAVAESLESFATPIPFLYQGRKELLVVGGDAITGHDLTTGEEFWRWETWNPEKIGHWRHVPSPVAGDGVILVCAPKRDPIYAVAAGGNGDLSDDALLWVSKSERILSSDVPTPAFYDGDFFVLSDVRKGLSRVEPRTMKIKWTINTPGYAKYEASPLAADGKIYLINFDAQVVVVDAATGKIINTIPMEDDARDKVRSSVIAANGKLFIRTNKKLFCIGG